MNIFPVKIDSFTIEKNECFLKDPLIHEKIKIKELVISIFREILYTIHFFWTNVCFSEFYRLKKCQDLKAEPSDKKGLVVFFHGLNGKPVMWKKHISKVEELHERNPEFDAEIYAPEVPKCGHVSVHDPELKEIYAKIISWAKSNPEKPIVVVGHSNGTRISLNLELLLRDNSPSNPVHLSLTAGVMQGTSSISLLNAHLSSKKVEKLFLGLLTEKDCTELAPESLSTVNMIQKARTIPEKTVAKRSYTKYAAYHDSLVREYSSSLLTLVYQHEYQRKEENFIVFGCGHNSIVDVVIQNQIKEIEDWIKKSDPISSR